MQLPYTVKAKKAIDIAGKMSKSLHHNYIGTEHLLIGLLKENSGVAAKILNENGVELDKIVDLIKELIAPAEGTAVAESDGYSPRAAKVLENAEKEAVRFHADAIGTEHILIAMIKETDCVASRLLTTLSVNMQKVFVDTLIAMGEDANLYREEFQNGRPGKKKNRNPVLRTVLLWSCPAGSLLGGAVTLGTGLGYEMHISTVVPVFVGLLFLILGNYLPKIRQNRTVGIKLPWTLQSEENWTRTHRLSGFLWVLCGLVMIPLSLLRLWSGWLFGALLAVMVLIPTIYSYALHRKGI